MAVYTKASTTGSKSTLESEFLAAEPTSRMPMKKAPAKQQFSDSLSDIGGRGVITQPSSSTKYDFYHPFTP
jgi:hypothetical protein